MQREIVREMMVTERRVQSHRRIIRQAANAELQWITIRLSVMSL